MGKKCAYCGELIEKGQLSIIENSKRCHLVCSAQEADGVDIDNSMGDSG